MGRGGRLRPKLPTLRACEVGAAGPGFLRVRVNGLSFFFFLFLPSPGSFRRLRSADSSDSPSGGPRTGHSDSEDGGALGWTVLASSASHSAGRAGLSGQRVPSGVGNAGHACDSLQAAAAVVGAKSPGHPAGLGLLREHGDRAVPPPRSGRPEWIHT